VTIRRYYGELALVIAAFFYGSTFPLVKDALVGLTPMGYLFLRFAVATLALMPFAVVIARSKRQNRRMLLKVGFIAGILLFIGYITQTVGLQYTTPSTSAFFTSMGACFVPIIEAVVRRHIPSPVVIVGIAIATVGLYLLNGANLDIGWGISLTLVCALFFAGWVVYIGAYANRLNPISLTTVQLVVVTVFCFPAALGQGIGSVDNLAIFAIVFTGIGCSAIAFSLQTYSQRRISPSRTALILLLEPVFAVIVSALYGEHFGAISILGAVVILVGISITEFGPGRRKAEAADVEAESELESRLH
jgi:drug/metabolite transporter (DMT)-like permease